MYIDDAVIFGLVIVAASTVAVVGVWRFILNEMKKSDGKS